VSEKPRTEASEEDEQSPLLPALVQPDELRWWELQLGVGLAQAPSWLPATASPE
jgi:hypothetical protein